MSVCVIFGKKRDLQCMRTPETLLKPFLMTWSYVAVCCSVLQWGAAGCSWLCVLFTQQRVLDLSCITTVLRHHSDIGHDMFYIYSAELDTNA